MKRFWKQLSPWTSCGRASHPSRSPHTSFHSQILSTLVGGIWLVAVRWVGQSTKISETWKKRLKKTYSVRKLRIRPSSKPSPRQSMSKSDDADQIKVVSKIMHLKWSCFFDTTPDGLFVKKHFPETPSNHLNLWISLSHYHYHIL